MLWIANEDTNRAFQISFPTRPENDSGIPHVFEHATLFGSEKYPSSSLFMGICFQTYNTYMNAYTYDAMTCFPVSSLSEDQLLHLADYYTDSCFHPTVMTDESIFRTQAWHYNLPDMDSELTYEGVVYSEIQGSMTLEEMALEHANDATFPGSALSYSFGGLTEHIPDMTWEDVKDYHDRYYHPSNSFTILYGRLDHTEDFLQLLDEAFAGYEKKEFSWKDDGYTPITESVTAEYGYPVAEETDTANQSAVIYYILCPGMKGDTEQEYLTDHLCAMLNQDGSVLAQKMEEEFPSAVFSCGREVAGPDDAVVFTGFNLNEDDAETFKALVDDVLDRVAAEGFPQDMTDSAMASLSISMKLGLEDSDPVEGVIAEFAYDFAVTGNPFAYAEKVDALNRIGEESRQGLLQKTAENWLTGDVLYTLTTTYPVPGEMEKQEAALAEKLAEIKAGMSEEELQAIIDETNAPEKNEDISEWMAQIKAVTVESLPEEIRTYEVLDETDENGIRHIEVEAGVDGIGHAEILLDAAALPQEDIHWMRLFTRLVGELDTESHTEEELDVLSLRYLYDRTIGVECVDEGDAVHPYLVAEWTAMDDDLAAGYDLIEELLFRTQFTDTVKLSARISAQKTAVRNSINASPYTPMIYRGLSAQSPFYAYYSYLNYLDYYAFLEATEAQMAEDPEGVVAHLQAIQDFFRNHAGAVAAYAGNGESIALNRPLADAFLGRLEYAEREAVAYVFEAPAKNEALVFDGNTQYNCVFATLADMGLTEEEQGLDVVSQLVSDQILYPVLRDQMGAYGVFNMLMDDGSMILFSYMDPNLRETFEVYAGLADRIEQIEVDQDTLDGYIMSAYSALALPNGELTGALAAIEDTLAGTDPEQKLTRMRQLKAVTPETVKAAAEIYRNAWENGTHSTAGSAAKVNKAADLYEVILNPFNAKDLSAAEFADVPEDSDFYAAVHFAVENGWMAPVSATEFGVEAGATVGDLAAAVYALVGGPVNAAEEARDFLAGYGLMDADQDLDAELTEQALCGLMAGLGVGLTTDTPDAVVSRGDLADLLKMIGAEE